jgi:NAD(P)-dependent dehydrogenase (short-subunit alcohol dehydrogenase family)
MTALGRVGLPDDIGPMVASLLGPDNRWVNGQRIEVSGGQTIRSLSSTRQPARSTPPNGSGSPVS